jgi:hypothetical protein
MLIHILHGMVIDPCHKFIELFTSAEKLEEYLVAHPEVVKLEHSLHEVDPK